MLGKSFTTVLYPHPENVCVNTLLSINSVFLSMSLKCARECELDSTQPELLSIFVYTNPQATGDCWHAQAYS